MSKAEIKKAISRGHSNKVDQQKDKESQSANSENAKLQIQESSNKA
jgi:hypothetical protein